MLQFWYHSNFWLLSVSRAFTFKQQCQRSDQTLRTFLKSGEILKETDNNNVEEIYTTIESMDIDQTKTECIIEEAISEIETEEEHHFTASDEISTTNDNLDTDLVLDSLPPEIESDAFEEEIELSSLPSESQFSAVAEEDIQKHLVVDVLTDQLDGNETQMHKVKNLTSKFGDYFDQIKLDVTNVVSLADNNELAEQSIVETFGKLIMNLFTW